MLFPPYPPPATVAPAMAARFFGLPSLLLGAEQCNGKGLGCPSSKHSKGARLLILHITKEGARLLPKHVISAQIQEARRVLVHMQQGKLERSNSHAASNLQVCGLCYVWFPTLPPRQRVVPSPALQHMMIRT